jgi:agmatinase
MSCSEKNFLGLSKPAADFETAAVAVLGLPYESSTTYGKGTYAGPEAIIAASNQVELYDEELQRQTCETGIATIRPAEAFAMRPQEAVNQISDACKQLLAQQKFVVGLGGEHTITVGMVQAIKAYYPDIRVLQLDAHSDLRDSYNGSPYNHACVMARVQEMCPYVGVGIRSGIANERNLLRESCRLFYAHEMRADDKWPEKVSESLGQPVYITIDLDFFDPSVVPSVGTPEPGGFHWYETLALLRRIARSHKIVGFDVVELLPKAGFPASDFFAAKLIYRLLGYVSMNNKQ